jgi:hypothetical protein
VTDPDGSVAGWMRASDGALVGDEPQGSPGPCNDTPRAGLRHFSQVWLHDAGKPANW